MLNFVIDKQNIELDFDAPIVADTINYLTAQFSFSSDWDGLTKVMHLRNADRYYSFELENDEITHGLSLTAGIWEVWFHGYAENKRVTTNSVKLEVMRFANIEGEPYPEIPESVLEKLMVIIKLDGDGTKYLADDGEYRPLVISQEAIEEQIRKYLEEHPIAVPTKVSAFTNDVGYITSSALEGYAKDIDVPTKTSELTNDSGFLTSHQDLSAYALKTEIPTVPTKVSAFENDKGYLTSHQDLSAYAKKSEIPTVPTNVSAFVNDKGYLTEHQSLSGYATETYVQNYVNSLNGNGVAY